MWLSTLNQDISSMSTMPYKVFCEFALIDVSVVSDGMLTRTEKVTLGDRAT